MHASTHNFLVNYGPCLVIGTAALALGLMAIAAVVFFVNNACTGCAKPEHGSHDTSHH